MSEAFEGPKVTIRVFSFVSWLVFCVVKSLKSSSTSLLLSGLVMFLVFPLFWPPLTGICSLAICSSWLLQSAAKEIFAVCRLSLVTSFLSSLWSFQFHQQFSLASFLFCPVTWHSHSNHKSVLWLPLVPNSTTRTPAAEMLYNTNGRSHNNSTTCFTTKSPPTDKNLPHPTILTCRDVGLWHCDVANLLYNKL